MIDLTRVLLAAVIGTTIYAISCAWTGFAFSVLWGWYLVPLGLPTITWRYALGVAVTISVVTTQFIPFDTDEYGLRALAHSFVVPTTALLIGWIVV